MNITEETLRLLIALLVGGIIGIEREFRSKAAGFRTMVLICTGSTLFTILSVKLGLGSQDRIAANILTGIGFIGAGVVFKEGPNVIGLTTAATIWITAALGMAIGAGEYQMACEGTILTIVVLFLFEFIQNKMISVHQKRSYRITCRKDKPVFAQIEAKLIEIALKYNKKTETKRNEDRLIFIEVIGSKKKIDIFNEFLIREEDISAFDT